MRLNPGNGQLNIFNGVSNVNRIYVDTRVQPRAVYASFNGGLAVIRAK